LGGTQSAFGGKFGKMGLDIADLGDSKMFDDLKVMDREAVA